MMSLWLSPSQPRRRLTSFGRCRRDQRGMAAVEFALVLPFLLLLFLGSVELTRGIQVDRQVALTADTVTNLVAQYTTISKSQQMPDILNASVQIFPPYPSSNVR